MWASPGGGAVSSSSLLDFQARISGNTLTILPGRARIGSYVPVSIASGSATFASGGGNVKVFVDASQNLVCHMQTGIVASTGGSMACSAVSNPTYPPNCVPLVDVYVSNGVPAVVSDDRAFLSTRGISAGAGISISDSGGVASVGIDTATVGTLGGRNDWIGENDFSQAAKFVAPAQPGQLTRINTLSWLLTSTQSTFEIPATTQTVVPNSLKVYRNGILMRLGTDYVRVGDEAAAPVAFTAGQMPQGGDVVILDYMW
jgi:hypothetical protein